MNIWINICNQFHTLYWCNQKIETCATAAQCGVDFPADGVWCHADVQPWSVGTSAVEWRVITVIEMCSAEGTLIVWAGLSCEVISVWGSSVFHWPAFVCVWCDVNMTELYSAGAPPGSDGSWVNVPGSSAYDFTFRLMEALTERLNKTSRLWMIWCI